MTTRQYATPLAFKQALEQRLRTSSATGVDFPRRRQLLVIDRFLARVTQVAGESVVLKGGLVLELRLAPARTTKDIDLRLMGSSDDVLDMLQREPDVVVTDDVLAFAGIRPSIAAALSRRLSRRREAPRVHDASTEAELAGPRSS